jgi:outer membrane protein assembly factor BamB
MNTRAALGACLLSIGAATSAQSPSEAPKLDGWWRASATHAGESKDFFLHFEERSGKPVVRFSIPWIAADGSPLGPYKIEGSKVIFPAVGWSLALDEGGKSLSGTIPSDIVPVYQISVRFERADAPEQPKVQPAGKAPEPIWQRRLDGSVFGPLAYDRSTRSVIVGTDAGTLAALAATNGSVRWSAKLGAPIRAAATVARDGIYVATDTAVAKLGNSNGRILWRRAFTGTIAPRKDMTDPASRWDHYGSSVVLSDGLAIVGSRDGCVYALKQRDGVVQQRICSGDVIASTPVVTGGQVYFSSFDHNLYAANLATGAIAWKTDLKAPAPGDLALVDGRILAGSRSYDLTAHDPDTGKIGWTNYFWFSWIDSAPVEDRGQLLVGSSDGLRLFALDPRTGRTDWSTFIGGWAWARPAADERNAYAGAVGTKTLPYIGPRSGGLAAVDRTNGRLKWLFTPPHDPKAVISGFASGPLAIGGRVYAADLEGNVFALPAR